MEVISISESKRLIQLEKSIETGRKTFVEVGMALAEIREQRLYRADFKTFEEYCREKWGWTRMRASQLIEAAGVTESLPESVKHVLQNDRQAGALAKVAPEKRAEVLEKVAEAGQVTAKAIKEAAQDFYEPGVNSLQQPSEEAQAADSESDSFFQLKRWWKKAGKQDRKKFLRWVESNGE